MIEIVCTALATREWLPLSVSLGFNHCLRLRDSECLSIDIVLTRRADELTDLNVTATSRAQLDLFILVDEVFFKDQVSAQLLMGSFIGDCGHSKIVFCIALVQLNQCLFAGRAICL